MSAADFVPAGADLDQLREAAKQCQGCHLWEDATQTVFGRGSSSARVVFVGEQPGDVEDQRGEPFVGPAGVLLRRAVGDAGLDPADLYVTNAVKHFKFKRQRKRRLHHTPDRTEVIARPPALLAAVAHLAPRCGRDAAPAPRPAARPGVAGPAWVGWPARPRRPRLRRLARARPCRPGSPRKISVSEQKAQPG